MPVPDPFRQGLESGWITHDASRLEHDLTLEADVAVIGSGAGGAPALYSVDVSGRNLKQVPTPGAASDPSWSPLLP